VTGQAATRSDVDRMLDMFSALGLGETANTQYMITIPGAPWSKARPRFARNGHVYSRSEDLDAEKRTAAYLRRAVREPFTGNVGLACLFFRPNRQRIDVDNLLKHVCDAANGILWLDDSQCTAIMGVVELDAERPRTVVVVGEHISTLKRGSDDSVPCRSCGKLVGRGSRARDQPPKTCSRACRQKSLGYPDLAELVPCGHCGRRYRRRVRTQKFCGEECRVDSRRNARKAASAPFSRCADCGKELTHRRGGRCRDCWKADVRARKRSAGVNIRVEGELA